MKQKRWKEMAKNGYDCQTADCLELIHQEVQMCKVNSIKYNYEEFLLLRATQAVCDYNAQKLNSIVAI